jgi:hypothetical protein
MSPDMATTMRATAGAIAMLSALACAPSIRVGTPPGDYPFQMAQFWTEPADLASRDLYWGPWGRDLAPDPAEPFAFVEKKKQGMLSGFSPGYTVKDARGVEWSAKQGDEAQAEVTASRLVWALGYHQPPVYYLETWNLTGGPNPGPQTRARFRPDMPAFDRVGQWSWHSNPFVGTEPYKGLLVMMAMLNNSDLKPDQNAIYNLAEPRDGLQRWYLVRDLGQSFGETGKILADRNDVVEFETEKFVLGVDGGRVRFNWTGRWGELMKDLTPADVRWTCERLSRLTPQQWQDAFRAGGYDPALAERFIKRFQEKIAEGMRLSEAGASTAAR